MNTKLLIGVGVLCTTALVGTAALLTANAAPADVPTVASALVVDDPAHTIGDIDIFGERLPRATRCGTPALSRCPS